MDVKYSGVRNMQEVFYLLSILFTEYIYSINIYIYSAIIDIPSYNGNLVFHILVSSGKVTLGSCSSC